MGAGKWPNNLTPFFKGADVVILPDNDAPGKEHANLVAGKLHGAAKRVRVLELPGPPHKGDVADWIGAGGTLLQLNKLAETDSRDDEPNESDGPLPLFPPLQNAEPYPLVDRI
jgi:putative DNA primase/helicase